MAQEYSAPFYNSRAWKDCRESYYKSMGGLCERCLQRGIYAPGEIVHHIKPITHENVNDPEVTLNFANLMLLCRDCHAEIHSGNVPARYTLDELGRVRIK